MNAKSAANKASNNTQNFTRFKALNLEQQALVAATLVERMLPNYLLFSQVCEFGDSKAMSDALNIIWEKQSVKNLKLSYDKQLEKIEPNIPDVAEFDMFGVYPALDMAMALISLVNGMSGANEFGFVDVCKLSLASVTKVAEQELAGEFDSFTEAQLDAHELVQYECDFVAELIDTVERHNKPNKGLIKQMRERALADGISNIGIEVG